MNRRDLLRTGATAVGLATLSGCTAHRLQEAEREPPPAEAVPDEDVDLPVTEHLEVAAADIERAAGAAVGDLEELAAYLREEGIDVETLEETTEAGTPLVSLEYVVEVTAEVGLMDHMGVVAGGYAALVEAGHESETLEAHLLDPDGEAFGEYEVRRHWAEQYASGESSAREYAEEITVTAAST